MNRKDNAMGTTRCGKQVALVADEGHDGFDLQHDRHLNWASLRSESPSRIYRKPPSQQLALHRQHHEFSR